YQGSPAEKNEQPSRDPLSTKRSSKQRSMTVFNNGLSLRTSAYPASQSLEPWSTASTTGCGSDACRCGFPFCCLVSRMRKENLICVRPPGVSCRTYFSPESVVSLGSGSGCTSRLRFTPSAPV